MTSPGVDIPKEPRALTRILGRLARALTPGPGAALPDDRTQPKASIRAVRPNTPLVWPEDATTAPDCMKGQST